MSWKFRFKFSCGPCGSSETVKAAVSFGCVLVLAGCQEAGPPLPADARVTYDTVNGVPHVISGNRGEWVRGGSWSVPAEGVTIGQLDGPEELTFGQLSGVVVDSDQRIHVADTQAKDIRVFSRDGAFVTRFGREGEGPGEFRNISGLALAPNGVAALDGRLGRVTVLGPEGKVVRSFRIERPYMILEHDAPMAFDRQGRFFDRARLSRSPGVDSMGVITYSRAGEVVDTALVAVIEQDHLVVERDGRPIMSFPRPFAPQASLAFGPDGTTYVSRGDEYRIAAISPAGDTLRVIRRAVRPRPVTETERDSAMEAVAERFADAGAKPPPGIQLPGSKPIIARLVVDSDGYLWVLNQPDPSWSRMEWSVHDPEGRYLGAVAAPLMNVMHIGRDVIAGVTYDELGVARVAVYPIAK